jgi:ATP/ADP translocase/HEAT repeat protein
LKKALTIFYDIREDEWKASLSMFLLHFLLMVVLYFLKPARDSLFLTQNGPSELPYVYILLAFASIPVTQLLAGVMGRFPIRKVLSWTFGFLSLNLLLLRWLFNFRADWVFMLFYVWVGIFGILVISLFWLFANAVFKPAQSKRIFSFLTLGAILGAIMGSQASSLIVAWLNMSTENLIYICAVLLLGGTGIVYLVPSAQDGHRKTDEKDGVKSESGSAIRSFARIVRSPYQFTIATIIGITMIATTFTDYQFKAIAFDSYSDTAALTAFLGTFYAGISLASLGIQVLLSSQIIKKMGLAGAVLSRPVGMMVGAVLMLVEPVLASVVILNGIDGATRYSIDKTGRELLFLPLSQHTKEQTKIFIDIFVDRFARGLGGVFLLVAILLLGWSVYLLTYIVIGLLLLWIALGVVAKRGYVEEFRNSVQKQLIDPADMPLDLNEPAIYTVIHDCLTSNDNTQILHALNLLKNSHVEPVAEELSDLLDSDQSEIKLRALKLLQDVESVNLTDKIIALLEDDDPEIRLETIYYLCRHSRKDPTAVIKSYLNHNDFKLKSAALGCASKHSGEASDLVEEEFFENLLEAEGKDAVVIKAQIADALGYMDDNELTRKYLSKLLQEHEPPIIRKVIKSMGRLKNDRLIPMLIDKLEEPQFRIEIRKALASFGTDRLILFKDRFFDEDQPDWVRKSMPAIFGYHSDQKAVDYLLEMLQIDRPDLRYHVVKALNKVRKRHDLQMDEDLIREVIEKEAKIFFELLVIKNVQPPRLPNQLLLKALSEKMGQTIERMFRLLGLVYPSLDIYGAYLGLTSISPDKHSAAFEFLDNILSDNDRQLILPIVDKRDAEEKAKIGKRRFGLSDLRYDEALTELIQSDDHWLQVCALYSVSPQCPDTLQRRVKKALESPFALVRETAELVLKRNSTLQKA